MYLISSKVVLMSLTWDILGESFFLKIVQILKFKKKNLNFQVSNLREASDGCLGQYSGTHREHNLLSQLSEAYTFLALAGYHGSTLKDLFSFPIPLKFLFNLSLRNSQQPSSR